MVKAIGIKPFVKLAKREGRNAPTILNMLAKPGTSEVVKAHGIEPILYLLDQAKERSYQHVSDLMSQIFSAAGHTLRSESDVRDAGRTAMRLTADLKPSELQNLSTALSLFEDDISCKDDLIDIIEMLMIFYDACDSDMGLVFDVLKASRATRFEDLRKGLFYNLKEAARSIDDEKLHVMLAWLYAERDCNLSVMHMDRYEKKHGHSVDALAKIRFKCVFAMMHQIEKDPATDSLILEGGVSHNQRTRYVGWLKRQFKDICLKYPDSKYASMSRIMLDALEEGKSLELKTTSKGAGVTVKAFRGIAGISLVYVDKSQIPEIIPGKARVRYGSLVVPKYDGRYRVVFRRPRVTLLKNNDALLETFRILPSGMFENLDMFNFTGKKYSREGVYLLCDEIHVHQGKDKVGTIVHELGHHWDLSISVDNNGDQGGPGDPSKIFYRISWARRGTYTAPTSARSR